MMRNGKCVPAVRRANPPPMIKTYGEQSPKRPNIQSAKPIQDYSCKHLVRLVL